MTATLKNTTQGYVLIVDERPKRNEWYYYFNEGLTQPISQALFGYKNNYADWYRIIASETPLEGVKGIRFRVNKNIIFHNDGNYERLVKKLIDTEVQATEHKEYWVVGL